MKSIKFALLLALSFVLCSLSGIASADSAHGQGDDHFEKVLQQVDQLKANGGTDQDVLNFLNSNDVEVLAHNTIILDSKGNEVSGDINSIKSLDPSLRVINNYITTDSGRYYAWVQIDVKATLPVNDTYEKYPASYDIVSINWDPAKFNYVAYGTTNANMWLADADQRNSGTILFNIYDNLDAVNTKTVSAYAKLDKKATGLTTTSMKYTHTYDTTQKSTTYTGTASWVWGGKGTLGVNYSVTITDKETNWTSADSANITL